MGAGKGSRLRQGPKDFTQGLGRRALSAEAVGRGGGRRTIRGAAGTGVGFPAGLPAPGPQRSLRASGTDSARDWAREGRWGASARGLGAGGGGRAHHRAFRVPGTSAWEWG